MSTTIWWVRRDLRLTDNAALHAALQEGEKVLPVYVLDRRLLQSRYNGEKRTAFHFAGLRALDADLRSRGSRLVVRSGDPAAVLAQVCTEAQASAVFAARDYSPFAVRRDAAVAAALPVPLHRCEGVAARAPDSVLKDDGSPLVIGVWLPTDEIEILDDWKVVGLEAWLLDAGHAQRVHRHGAGSEGTAGSLRRRGSGPAPCAPGHG